MKYMALILAVATLAGCATTGSAPAGGEKVEGKNCYEFTAVYQGDGQERTHMICNDGKKQKWVN